jgi:hypothetical protein
LVLELFVSSISGAGFFASDLDLGADAVAVLIFPTGKASPESEISIGSDDDLFRVISSAGEAIEDDSDDDDEDEDDEDNSLLSDPDSDDSGLSVPSESVIGVVSEV